MKELLIAIELLRREQIGLTSKLEHQRFPWNLSMAVRAPVLAFHC
jgi:hypothetical protein